MIDLLSMGFDRLIRGASLDGLLIPTDAPLDFESFKTFVEKRSVHLSNILMELGKFGQSANACPTP